MPCKKNSTRRRVRPTKNEPIKEEPVIIEHIKEGSFTSSHQAIPDLSTRIGVMFFPVKEPIEIQLNQQTWKQEVNALLKCDNPYDRTCAYLEPLGYKVHLFSTRNAYAKGLLYNSVATHIAKVTVYGDAIIIKDDNREPFTLQDLNKVAELADNFEIDRSMCKVQARLKNITNELSEMKGLTRSTLQEV